MRTRVAVLTMVVCLVMIFMGGCKQGQTTSPDTQGQQPVVEQAATPQTQETANPVTTPDNGVMSAPANTTPVVADDKAGILTAEPMVLDFGLIEPTAEQKGKFVLKNIGPSPLKIRDVKSGCGCTIAKLTKYDYKPGDTGDLEFVYSPGNYPGKASKNIYVYLEAPGKPETLTLTFTAEIRKVIDIMPERLTFNIKKGADNSGVITLKSTTNETFKVTGFTCRDDVVTGEFDANKEADTHEIKYKVNTDGLRKLNSGIINITTTNPKLHNLAVYYASVMPIVAQPPTRRFAALVPGKPSESYIKVISNFNEPFELGEITSQKGLVKVLKTEKTSDGYQIDIAMSADEAAAGTAATRYISDTLIINIKDYPEDSVRVYCYGQVVKDGAASQPAQPDQPAATPAAQPVQPAK